MKVKTAVGRVWELVNARQFVAADALLTKFRRKFGNRPFTYMLRLHIKNGLYFG